MAAAACDRSICRRIGAALRPTSGPSAWQVLDATRRQGRAARHLVRDLGWGVRHIHIGGLRADKEKYCCTIRGALGKADRGHERPSLTPERNTRLHMSVTRNRTSPR